MSFLGDIKEFIQDFKYRRAMEQIEKERNEYEEWAFKEYQREFKLLASEIKEKGIFGRKLDDESIEKITSFYYSPHLTLLSQKNADVEGADLWKDMREKGIENIILKHNYPMEKAEIISMHFDFLDGKIDSHQLWMKQTIGIIHAEARAKGENPYIAEWMHYNGGLVELEGLQNEKVENAFKILYNKGFVKHETIKKAMEYERTNTIIGLMQKKGQGEQKRPHQKRVSPQVRAEMEKKMQKQGRGR